MCQKNQNVLNISEDMSSWESWKIYIDLKKNPHVISSLYKKLTRALFFIKNSTRLARRSNSFHHRGKHRGRKTLRASQGHARGSSFQLGVDRVDGPVVVIALDVRVDVRPVLAGVDAMRAPEARRLAALVLEVPVQPAVPLVDLSTLGTFVVARCRGVRHRGRPDPQSASTADDGNDGAVAGATVESCKSTGLFVSRRGSPRGGGLNDNT